MLREDDHAYLNHPGVCSQEPGALKRPGGDSGDLWGERGLVPQALDRAVALGQHCLLVGASQRAHQQARRELSALRSIASRASPAKNIGTSRISEPLPADIASVGPENGSPVEQYDWHTP